MDTYALPSEDGFFEPLPHDGLVLSGVLTGDGPQAAVPVDSFRVYNAPAGGWVFHSRYWDGQETTEAWMEVDAGYRPLRGWQTRSRGSSRCRVAFVAVERAFQMYVESGLGTRGVQARHGIPSRYGIDLRSPSALAWLVRAADSQPGSIQALALGPCRWDDTARSGYGTYYLSSPRPQSITAAGESFPESERFDVSRSSRTSPRTATVHSRLPLVLDVGPEGEIPGLRLTVVWTVGGLG